MWALCGLPLLMAETSTSELHVPDGWGQGDSPPGSWRLEHVWMRISTEWSIQGVGTFDLGEWRWVGLDLKSIMRPSHLVIKV